MQINSILYSQSFEARTKYPLIQKPELKQLMKNGMTYREISEKYNMPLFAVARSVKHWGLDIPNKQARELNRQKIISMREQGYSKNEIKKELNVSMTYIDNVLKNVSTQNKSPVSDSELIANLMKKLKLENTDVLSNLK